MTSLIPPVQLLKYEKLCNIFTCRALHGAALFLGRIYIVQYIRSDDLARSKYRDSRRIAHYGLSADPSDRLLDGKLLLLGIESLLRCSLYDRCYILGAEEISSGL